MEMHLIWLYTQSRCCHIWYEAYRCHWSPVGKKKKCNLRLEQTTSSQMVLSKNNNISKIFVDINQYNQMSYLHGSIYTPLQLGYDDEILSPGYFREITSLSVVDDVILQGKIFITSQRLMVSTATYLIMLIDFFFFTNSDHTNYHRTKWKIINLSYIRFQRNYKIAFKF